MLADDTFKLFVRDIGTFNDDFFSHHNSGSNREIKLEIRIGVIFSDRLGYGFDLNVILVAYPGHHLYEMLSRLTVGFIEKKSDF